LAEIFFAQNKFSRVFGVGVEFNAQPDTVYVISEAIITADHLTGTDKQNSVQANTETKYNSKSKQCKIQQNKTRRTLIQSPLTTFGQEKRRAYSA